MYAGVPTTEPASECPSDASDRTVRTPRPPHHLGQAPIHHLQLAEGADHHVGRLQVAVDHPLAVGVGQRLAHLLEHLKEARQVAGRRVALLEQDRQRLAFHQLHGEVGPVVGKTTGLVDGHDAGMLQLAADLRLFQETLHGAGIVVVVFQQDLDGEFTAQFGVAARKTAPMPPRPSSPRIS